MIGSLIVCNIFSCRHANFTKYFGDSLPDCNKMCDVCKNSKAVENKITGFNYSVIKRNMFSSASRLLITKDNDENDLYEGGRNGRKK